MKLGAKLPRGNAHCLRAVMFLSPQRADSSRTASYLSYCTGELYNHHKGSNPCNILVSAHPLESHSHSSFIALRRGVGSRIIDRSFYPTEAPEKFYFRTRMKLPRRVPWSSLQELDQVCSWIYTDENDIDAKIRAVQRVSISSWFFRKK